MNDAVIKSGSLRLAQESDLIATLVHQVQVHPPERRGGRTRVVVVPLWEAPTTA